MIVTGIEKVTFTNKEGQQVSFTRVTLLRDIAPERGIGQSAEVVNCSPDKSAGLEVGDLVKVFYNRYGKVEQFDILDR